MYNQAGRSCFVRIRPGMLVDNDPIGVGVDIDWTTDCAWRLREYLLLSNRTRHVFDAEALLSMKPVEAPR